MNTRGKFIVIDGMDGSGKGTQLKMLQKYLLEHNIEVVFTREPGGCPDAEIIRERILHDTSLTEEERFNLVWEGRALHIEQTILPALDAGKLVVCDRFDSSTWAYQICAGEHSELAAPFRELRMRLVSRVCSPDLYVVFDLEPAISRARVMGDGTRTELSVMDQKPLEYYVRVRAGFKEFAGAYPVSIIEAHQAPEYVFEQFISALKMKGII